MKFGFIPTEGGAYYQEFLEEVLLGEALGFDSVWVGDHVLWYVPSPDPAALLHHADVLQPRQGHVRLIVRDSSSTLIFKRQQGIAGK